MHPTLNPSTNPTLNPLTNLSTNPTLNPLTNPSTNLTLNPLTNLSTNPTLNPLTNPTHNLSTNLSINSPLTKTPLVQPPWTKLGKKIESSIRKALYDFNMLDGVNKIAIALSGGKDSLALLFMLKAISGRGFPDLDIHAIHVHGEFSCGAGVDIRYLQNICASLNVNFIVRESTQKLETLECYSCSRERRRLLFEAAKSVGAHVIAFGHHRDDHAQTLLMNLLHKGEFSGNLPSITMHDYGVTIIRPLAYVAENDIRTFAQQQGFARIMCRCPVGQNSMRKKVDKIIDELEKEFPNARANLASAGHLYGSDKASRK